MSENYISEYWDWLSSIDPRLKDILVALDDEMCSGRVGTRSNFNGDFECRLYNVANDGDDFVELYIQSDENRIKAGTVEDHDVRFKARKLWNIITHIRNELAQEFADELSKG